MKNKFKLCVMAALALFVGVTSCSKGDSDLADGQKRVRVRIDLADVQSRSVGNETAKDEMPDFSDLKLFFVGSGIVQHVETITSSGDKTDIQAGKTFVVPSATTKVYAVGNVAAGTGVGSPTAFPGIGAAESAVKGLMIEVDKQTSFKVVNLSQGQGAAGVAGDGATFGSDDAATFDIVPAVARYEIKKIVAGTTTAQVEQPLSGFKLAGIYITNTYRTLGLDYATLPTAPADIINAGPTSPVFEDAVPDYLKNEITPAAVAATEFIPTEGAGYFWHYFVMPPIEGKGTELAGNSDSESSIPMIVVKVQDAAPLSGVNPYATTSYINVRRLEKTTGGEIKFLEPGKVYIIDEIVFGGEHLTEGPGDNHEKSVTVKVTVKPWIGESVKPIL